MSDQYPYQKLIEHKGPVRLYLVIPNGESGSDGLVAEFSAANLQVFTGLTDLPDKRDGYVLHTDRKEHKIAIMLSSDEYAPDFEPAKKPDMKYDVVFLKDTGGVYMPPFDPDETQRLDDLIVDSEADTKMLGPDGFWTDEA